MNRNLVLGLLVVVACFCVFVGCFSSGEEDSGVKKAFLGEIVNPTNGEDVFKDARYYVEEVSSDFSKVENGKRVVATNLAEYSYNKNSRHTLHDLYSGNIVEVYKTDNDKYFFSMTPTVIFFVAKVPTELELKDELSKCSDKHRERYQAIIEAKDARYVLVRQQYDNGFSRTTPLDKESLKDSGQDVLYAAINLSEENGKTHNLKPGTYVNVFSIKKSDNGGIYFFNSKPE